MRTVSGHIMSEWLWERELMSATVKINKTGVVFDRRCQSVAWGPHVALGPHGGLHFFFFKFFKISIFKLNTFVVF